MSNIISFFQKLIKGGVGIRVGGWKIFQKLISGGGTIIRYSRVQHMAFGALFTKSSSKGKFLLSFLDYICGLLSRIACSEFF